MPAVSVDLGSGTTVGTVPSIGVEPFPNWQQEFGFPNFTATNLEDNTGSGTTLDLQLAGAAGNVGTRAVGSGDLYNMFARGFGVRVLLEFSDLVITQIPYTNYKVYAYFCETSASSSGDVYSFSDGTTTYYYENQGADNFNGGTLGRVTSTDSGAPDTSGNYVLFDGLSGSSVTISSNSPTGSANELGIVGLQIVEASVVAANLSGGITESGDQQTSSVENVVALSASSIEAGDQQASAIRSIVELLASTVEAGDSGVAGLNAVVSLLADVVDGGDSQAADIINIVSLIGSVLEVGDQQIARVVNEIMGDIGDVSISSKTSAIILASKTGRVVVS